MKTTMKKSNRTSRTTQTDTEDTTWLLLRSEDRDTADLHITADDVMWWQREQLNISSSPGLSFLGAYTVVVK